MRTAFPFRLSPFGIRLFHYEQGLMLTRPRLAVDFQRRQPRGFVSHAHADHMARHELALATPETASLYRHRLGPRLRVKETPYGQTVDVGRGVQVTALPAGHCLGSAMLLADDGDQRLLYTGDYRLGGTATNGDPRGESLTATPADPPRADLLVMESTFGRPRYRMPPRRVVIEQLLEIVNNALADGVTPVIHAYALGKSQEITKVLTTAGVPVLQHPIAHAVSEVYHACGCDLTGPNADVACYAGAPLSGHAVVTLPRSMKGFRLSGLGPTVSIAVTGWAIDPGARHRLGVDHALPFSDHADFDELLETVRRVEPQIVYGTHGPAEFLDHVRAIGFDARPLAPPAQGRLF